MTVGRLLAARAADGRTGLVHAGDGRSWSWAEVVAECARRAAWLTARRAGGRPVHAGVLLDNVPELVFLIGGAALSGDVIVALNPTRSAAELAEDAARADCDLVLTQACHAGLAEGLGTVIDIDGPGYALPGQAPLPDISGITDATLLMLIFTSGTSGRPRAVRVTHRKVVVPGENLAGRLLKADDVVYCPMPLFHSGAIMAAYAPALAAGATLVVRSKFSASGLLPDVRAHGCTYLHYVGKALSYALATPAKPDDADNPLKIAFGNEAAPAEQAAFKERFGCYVIDAYGSSETAIAFSPDPSGPPGALGRLTDGVRVLNPDTGAECPPARFDDAGRLLNPDEAVGELVGTAGPGLFDGYYNEDAPDRLRDGMFWSGDHAYADENGYAFFVGRTADRLRVDGENFGAVQVERALAGLPGVRQLAVYGVPDAASGDQVMLALAADSFDPEAFAAHLRALPGLGAKWPPRYVRVAAELPATASNKILKRRLARDGWRTGDPVWWRPGRDLAYRRMTPGDAARLREEFARRGRLHLLEGSG
ncbi:AMP-binding protein [Actinomadura macrotermitis]|uniref:Long-chain-fatty-acid--CoA ligase FadD17 n=1 Tax=Actinomadura macrotermitis TaxID=2585200 RepID=A0A7K0BRE2_9ACTN|nr:AMP-binding protein [Actinomadura macrotermitis]MQY03294.1 Long-chain-fatty-acid--CoA ligase FadD17 [Actinomadura macrotermitis]